MLCKTLSENSFHKISIIHLVFHIFMKLRFVDLFLCQYFKIAWVCVLYDCSIGLIRSSAEMKGNGFEIIDQQKERYRIVKQRFIDILIFIGIPVSRMIVYDQTMINIIYFKNIAEFR